MAQNPQMPPSYMAYDRTIVVFSPDGRLLQVEYAREMVKNGSTSIGVIAKDCVVLGSVKSTVPLAVHDKFKKVAEVDDHIGVVSSGSLADARDLVDMSRVRAQINKVTYGEPISVTTLATYIADRKHMVTQYAGVRPYGVGLLVGGVDNAGHPLLFETEPSGTLIEWKAQAIGRGAEKARKVLEKEYKENMDVPAATKALLKALKAGEKDMKADNVEVFTVWKDKIEPVAKSDISKVF